MKKVTIKYNEPKSGIIEFETDKVFFKKQFGLEMIGFIPEGKTRKTWITIGGKVDSINDYSNTEVIIEEV